MIPLRLHSLWLGMGQLLGRLLVLGSGALLHHLVEDFRRLCCKLALHTDVGTLFVKDERKRDAGKGQKPGNGPSPLQPEVFVHVDCEERECGTKHRAQD